MRGGAVWSLGRRQDIRSLVVGAEGGGGVGVGWGVGRGMGAGLGPVAQDLPSEKAALFLLLFLVRPILSSFRLSQEFMSCIWLL